MSVCLFVSPLLLASPPAISAQEPAAELADAPGKDVVLAVCSDCHEVAPKIVKLRKTRAQWADLITDMQNRGMMADEKDLETVLNYLTANYGPPPEHP